jgi:hypothetical protein
MSLDVRADLTTAKVYNSTVIRSLSGKGGWVGGNIHGEVGILE